MVKKTSPEIAEGEKKKKNMTRQVELHFLGIPKARTIYPLWLTRHNKATKTEYKPPNILMCEKSSSKGLDCKQGKLCQRIHVPYEGCNINSL